MKEAVIVSAVRTAIGKNGGSLSKTKAQDLGAAAIKEAISRINLDQYSIEDVVYGNVLNGGGTLARLSALIAGVPVEVPGLTIDRQCCSGFSTLTYAASQIMIGYGDVYIAGGTENMSQRPFIMERTDLNSMAPPQWRTTPEGGPFPCSTPEIGDPNMGITAENLAAKYQISRQEQDEFAYNSQQKMAKAQAEGVFKSQIVPMTVRQGKNTIVFDTDEFPRPQTTLESLAKLPPSFKKDGTVTAGNSSGINDAASALVVMSLEKAKSLGLKPMAKVRAWGEVGVDPNIMGIGPVNSTKKALKRAGLSLSDIDLIEANEAFAAQTLAVDRELKFDMTKVNVNGGALAHGHPIGATGGILVCKLVYEMARRDVQFGLVTACAGGGQGVTIIFERI